MKPSQCLLNSKGWLALRPKATPALIAKALDILDRPTVYAPGEEDQLPKGYDSVRRKYAGKQ